VDQNGDDKMREVFLQTLRNNSQILEDFLTKMSSKEINYQIKDFWTIRQHVEHLITTQKVILARIKQFLVEEQPIMKPFIPETVKEEDPKEISILINEFKDIRNQQITLIEKAEDRIWKRKGTHPQYKKYSFEILVRHAILHDGFHMWRMEELWIENENLIMELNSN
jgi:uncharacterized damage-inducible protein DinB